VLLTLHADPIKVDLVYCGHRHGAKSKQQRGGAAKVNAAGQAAACTQRCKRSRSSSGMAAVGMTLRRENDSE